jgi:hypothetical protein
VVDSLAGPEVDNHPVVVLVDPISPRLVSKLSLVLFTHRLHTRIHMPASAGKELDFRRTVEYVAAVVGIVALHMQEIGLLAVLEKVCRTQAFARMPAAVAHMLVAIDHIAAVAVDHIAVAGVVHMDFAHMVIVMWAACRDFVGDMGMPLHRMQAQ